MGLNFRKSVSLGPFRVNLSKSGVGFSVGQRGFRTGISSTGRKYARASIPGTGISYDQSLGGKAKKGCLLAGVALIGGTMACVAAVGWTLTRALT